MGAPLTISKSTAISTESWVLKGIAQAVPIMLCYTSVGFAIGVVASQAGFSPIEMFLMCALVFSGSGQSIAIQLLLLKQPLFAIFTTTFIINLRYFLMAAVLAPHTKGWSKIEKLLFAGAVTDETFALNSSRFRVGIAPKRFYFAVNAAVYLSWIFGGTLGCLAAGLVADIRPFGLDYAVPGMFIALVVLQLESRLMTILAVLSATMVLVLKFSWLGDWAIIVTTLICATLGAILETKWKKG